MSARDRLSDHKPATSHPDLVCVLFASGPAAHEAANTLRQRLTPNLTVCADMAACLSSLQQHSASLLLVEESAAAAHSHALPPLYEAASSALVLEINFAIVSGERLLRQVQAALRQRAQDKVRATAQAKAELSRELTAILTGLLLESQLALLQAGAQAPPGLHRLVGLAEHASSLLREQNGPALPKGVAELEHPEPARYMASMQSV